MAAGMMVVAATGWRARTCWLLCLAVAALPPRATCQAAGGPGAGPLAGGSAAVAACETGGGPPVAPCSRRLAEQQALPQATILYFTEPGGQSPVECTQVSCGWRVSAGVNYSSVELQTRQDPETFSSNHSGARLKLILEEEEDCSATVVDERYVMGPWTQDGVETTVRHSEYSTAEGLVLSANEPMIFRMGGTYKLCYAANGTFGPGPEYYTQIKIRLVNGVYDKSARCASEHCISHQRYECYLSRDAYNTADGEYGLTTSCALDYSYDPQAGFIPPIGKASWSEVFNVTDYSSSGQVLGVDRATCGSAPPAAFICRGGGACDVGDAWVEPDGATKRIGVLPVPPVSELEGLPPPGFRARTVAACYCPDRDGCDHHADFVQQIGLLHFYLSKVCHAGDRHNYPYQSACDDDFTGVVAQYSFRVRVECPTDARAADSSSRLKVVEARAPNDRPSWESGCGAAEHGVVRGRQALPGGPQGCSICSRQDYVEFGGAGGFRFDMGSSVHEARNFHRPADFDVCYCNEACEAPGNWFKAGIMRLSPTRLVSSATERSNLPAQWTIEYVNQPGMFGLYRPYADSGVLGLQENGVLKITQDENKDLRLRGDDEHCSTSGYSSQLTGGLSGVVSASMYYLGKRQTQEPPDLQKIVFNSNSFVNTITVRASGIIAVCYCAITIDNRCAVPSNWKLVTHLTIKGPRTNQVWMFSTNVVFRFSYEGHGLTSADRLRIISPDGQCTDNNFNPNTAAFPYTYLQVKCPVPCTRVGLVNEEETGDLPTLVHSADTYQCDRNHTNCSINGISRITVLSETETELEFDHPHGMQDGDRVTLGDNIYCDHTDVSCTAEMLASLKGVFSYADDRRSGQAPATYMSTHRLSITPSPRRARIRVGWPQPAPRFEIIRSNADLRFNYIGDGGKWTDHSRAITREEIRAYAERANLRVCWKFGGNGGKFVAEVGKITIRDPAPMEGAMLSITGFERGKIVPMVLTFKTADGVTGFRYDQAMDSLRLKIVFNDTNMIDLYHVDGSEVVGDVSDVKQSTCGKLFLEVWSEDTERGFPLPMGCYYKTYEGQREIFLLFEAKSGLKSDTTYQLVFNARVMSADVVVGGTYMELYPMDDLTARPYEAIERGVVSLEGEAPKAHTGDEAFPVFGSFKIVGGHEELLEIRSGDSIVAEIMGGAEANYIRRNHILRVYLWPLTQWQTTSSCTAECVEAAEVSFLCGPIQYCRGGAVTPGRSLNLLRIQLPDAFENLYGPKKVRVRIGGITIPPGGFFASRLAAQVSTDMDLEPHYVVSVGDYLWKDPNQGQPVSKVISAAGGGNERPFFGDRDNVLYVRVLLSSTILGRGDPRDPDASFTITLPPGYACLDKNPSMAGGGNAWAAEGTLPVFGNVVPQGKGTPDDGTESHGWAVSQNQCTFTPEHPGGVIYAGSSMVIKVTVDNPTRPLKRDDASNLWTIQMSNKGLHPYVRQTSQPFNFLASGDEFYQSNVAVLGKIADATSQPSSLEVSTRGDMQDVSVFFRTQQDVGSRGSVHVHAPPGFRFGEPCDAADMAPVYYATDADPTNATLRLPGILSCNIHGGSVTHAVIRLERILVGGRSFGFRIRVMNPPSATPAPTGTGWQILTADASGFLIDGTPEPVPFFRSEGAPSWGVYPLSTLRPSLLVSDTRPFAMSGQLARVTLLLDEVPPGPSGSMRLVAPDGYAWEFQPAEFVHEAGVPGASPHVTASFPGGAPHPPAGGLQLVWPSVTFPHVDPPPTYGITAPIMVPRSTPTKTGNYFYFEMGFDSAVASARKAGARIDGPDIRALKNAAVGYTTTVRGKENEMQFSIETVTHIPAGGGLVITAPGQAEFTFGGSCEVIPVRDPLAPPPFPFQCTWGAPHLLLRVTGPQGLPPGLQRFAVLSTNPYTAVENYPTSATCPTCCGTLLCWSMATYQFLGDSPASSSVPLDSPTSARGFSVNRKMLEGTIPYLEEGQRRATGRDDRPLQPNNVVFAFRLADDVAGSSELLLRGPHGFVFAEECLSGVEVDEGTVFGEGNRFPPEYRVWPRGVAVSDCRGAGASARLALTVEPQHPESRLEAGQLYIFRVHITANPLVTPVGNRWTIELAGQAVEPIEGMTLWAFTHTGIVPITTARDRTLAGDVRTKNPLRISFRPFKDVHSGGEIRAEAPEGFQFYHRPSGECDVQMEELPYVVRGETMPGYTWPEEGLICLVDPGSSRLVTVRLAGARPVLEGLDYLLVLTVYNPSDVALEGDTSAPTVWKLSSFDREGLSLDESRITAFRINTVMNLFSYRNPDPQNPGQIMQNGGARLPAFTLQLRFPSQLAPGDQIVIIAPSDFELTDQAGRCRGFRWITAIPDCPSGSQSIFCTAPLCHPSNITFALHEYITADDLIDFGLEIYNPLRTPAAADNFWRCALYGPMSAGGARPIRSSKAFQSWDIVPQLTGVAVHLLGPNRAAEAVSAIRFSFTPVSDADDVAIEMVAPSGFDFSGATCEDSLQEIFLSSGPLVRIRRRGGSPLLTAGRGVSIVIRGVRLGREGGQTDISLTSWAGGMFQSGRWEPGAKQDEMLHFAGGFRLPGLVRVRYDRLENSFHQDPQRYPVQSLWLAQMGRPAYAEFRFHVTQVAQAGDFLVIAAPPYEPTVVLFTIKEALQDFVDTATFASDDPTVVRSVANRIETVNNGQLWARLEEPLIPYRVYQVVISVIAPSAAAVDGFGSAIRWQIETKKLNDDVPVNTNDGSSREFPIVEQYGFQVAAPRAPPSAEVEVSLIITPGYHAPTELRVVAPPHFNFSEGCLVYGGPDVLSCAPGRPMAGGRSTAVLGCREEGLRGTPPDVRLRVSTPAQRPTAREWFVEGVDLWTEAQLGWGEAAGIDVEQMADTEVVYPGIPGVQAYMVWRFRAEVLVQAGGWLHVEIPAGLSPECGEGHFVPIALPATGGCQVRDPQNIIIHLNSTIVPSEYAFAFHIMPPVSTPFRNKASIILYDRFGNVRDAAIDLDGRDIQEKLKIQAMPLHWTSSREGRTSMITLGFEALEPLPDLIVAPEQQVAEILISLPVGFYHMVYQRSDFTLGFTPDDMPLRDDDYLDYMQKDRLRVILNLSRTSWTTIKVGSFAFRFPVLVASPMPIFNVWMLSLCQGGPDGGPIFPGGCSTISDTSVLATFALPGFSADLPSPSSSSFTQLGAFSRAGRGAAPPALFTGGAALLALLALDTACELLRR